LWYLFVAWSASPLPWTIQCLHATNRRV
jgi:hypothetical protein